MILDEYKQCYIGQSRDIKKRVQRHWVEKHHDTGIDRFKALDTTRLYAYPMPIERLNMAEIVGISEIDNRFLLNKFAGGNMLLMLDKTSSENKYTTNPYSYGRSTPLKEKYDIRFVEDLNGFQ